MILSKTFFIAKFWYLKWSATVSLMIFYCTQLNISIGTSHSHLIKINKSMGWRSGSSSRVVEPSKREASTTKKERKKSTSIQVNSKLASHPVCNPHLSKWLHIHPETHAGYSSSSSSNESQTYLILFIKCLSNCGRNAKNARLKMGSLALTLPRKVNKAKRLWLTWLTSSQNIFPDSQISRETIATLCKKYF
jgi:hypothetical protein